MRKTYVALRYSSTGEQRMKAHLWIARLPRSSESAEMQARRNPRTVWVPMDPVLLAAGTRPPSCGK